MPFCPKCSSEYQQGVTMCYDCQVPLVEDLEATQEEGILEEEDGEEFHVEIFQCFEPVETELVVDILNEVGIESLVQDMGISMIPLTIGEGAEKRIFVRQEERNKAIETLRKAIEEERYIPITGQFV